MNEAYGYRFDDNVALRAAKETLLLSVLAAEGLFGETRIRMDFAFATDPSIHVLIVDASTRLGQAINGIFASFLRCEFGADAFDVHRVELLTYGLQNVSSLKARS